MVLLAELHVPAIERREDAHLDSLVEHSDLVLHHHVLVAHEYGQPPGGRSRALRRTGHPGVVPRDIGRFVHVLIDHPGDCQKLVGVVRHLDNAHRGALASAPADPGDHLEGIHLVAALGRVQQRVVDVEDRPAEWAALSKVIRALPR